MKKRILQPLYIVFLIATIGLLSCNSTKNKKMINPPNLDLPANLNEIIKSEGYWDDYETYEPLQLLIEPITYGGQDMISYQLQFEVLDQYPNILGNDWETTLLKYLNDQNRSSCNYRGDSESSTCVIWTNNLEDFKVLFVRTIELINNESEVTRLLNE